MLVSLIAAVAKNGTIGRNQELPWRLPDDMRFFRETTRGHHVITGRANYEAMGRPLPGRTNIVVTRNRSFQAPCPVASTLGQALEMARAAGEEEAFIIGGSQIYALALPIADRVYRTRVLAEVDGDVFFPPFDFTDWNKQVLQEHPADAKHAHAFVVELLSRPGS